MKLNKIVLWAMIPMVYACGNRKVQIADMSPAPTMDLVDSKGNSIDRDSIKVTLKTSTKKYASFKLNLGGSTGDKKISLQTVNTSGSLTVDGRGGNEHTLSNGLHSVMYFPNSINGSSLVVIELKDIYDKMASKKLEIITFDNLSPIASMKVTPSGVFSDKEYILDASGSSDRDSKYGGAVVNYVFTVNGKSFETVDGSPKAPWVFGESGKYNISVTVTDNDGATDTYNLPPFDVQ